MPRATSDVSTSVSDGLQRLRHAFPLEARIAALAPAVRVAYAAVLAHWMSAGSEGAASIVSSPELQALAAIDAVVIDGRGIGCYPFSARDSGIAVVLGGRSVYAMCAIDALAIPPLMRCTGRVTAACGVCKRALAGVVDAEGNVTDTTTDTEVVWHHRQTLHACCGDSLCPEIRFVCRSCATPPDATRFTLADASAIGGAFFAFQRELLTASLSTD